MLPLYIGKWSRISLIFVLFVLNTLVACSQSNYSTKSKKAVQYFQEADNYRVRGQFPQAIDGFLKALEKDKNFVEAYFYLGMTFKMQRKNDLAIQYFEKALAVKAEDFKLPLLSFEYGESLLKNGNYTEAKTYISDYLNTKSRDQRRNQWAEKMLMDIEYGMKNKSTNSQITPKPLPAPLNQFPMQYFPALTVNQKIIIYTKREIYGYKNDEDLLVSMFNEGKWSEPQSISNNINSDFNEGTAAISADGRTLIFTACRGRKSYGSCDLYSSNRVGNEWTEPVNLGPIINSPAWESQPSLSSDGRILYFVSERQNGFGGRDIYKSIKSNDGSWSVPQNLGPLINTSFDEVSPFIHANGKTLYFSSNGHEGFGGFDIYYSEIKGHKYDRPVNLGSPVNTSEDQVSLFITADGKYGYYSHEDFKGEYMSSQLYSFEFPVEYLSDLKSTYVFGKVVDAETKEPLLAEVELFDINKDSLIQKINTDPVSGDYLIVLTEGSEYGLYAKSKGYLFENLSFNIPKDSLINPVAINLELKKIKSGASTTLNNLFFDVGKYTLRDKSKTELARIVDFINQNKGIKVVINGHTDNSGTDAFNKTLSENRAKAVFDFLINKGVPKSQLTFMGYGSSKPRVPNDTPENKQLNRRIEFEIVE